MIRWRFYREHKFVLAMTNNLEQLIAKSDFTDKAHVQAIEKSIEELSTLMQGHGHYEDQAIHALLRAKGSDIHKNIEVEHRAHNRIFAKLRVLAVK